MSLVGEERKQQIIELLAAKGKVTSTELVQLFDVSKESVRRYLDELESEGKLRKVYGGAVKLVGHKEPPHLERIMLYREEKHRIGQYAAALVQDGEVLFLDEGTTALAVIEHLNQCSLTVLTNSIPAATLLIDRLNQGQFDGRVVMLGGEINAKHARCSDSVTESLLERYYVDKAFISVDGLQAEAGLTCLDDGKAAVSRKAIEHAAETIVVSDSSKLGLRHPYRISPLQRNWHIVCDQAPPADWIAMLEQSGITWLTAGHPDPE
ncbi:DeoR/GlpR family DNA-binding transcription regulator [Paenibacillus cremeus]|uniref:DeoR/GlpR family DNA-binding transcription regulator n=1 Tax=Paenibacillus cremeus TaxID=2163881 RepID=UPI0016473AA8|nr:DeoR/GlpR family DNA-binding transcription regulator [Paenibacillus cremeus]